MDDIKMDHKRKDICCKGYDCTLIKSSSVGKYVYCGNDECPRSVGDEKWVHLPGSSFLPATPNNMEAVSIRLPAKDVASIRERAKADGVSFGQICRTAIRFYLEDDCNNC